MAQTGDSSPPPYFNISPDAALTEMDEPVSTGDFAGSGRALRPGAG